MARVRPWLRFTVAAIAVGLPAPAVVAKTAGFVGYSGRDGFWCNDCHFGGTAPTVRFEGPLAVAPGAEVTYRFVVTAQGTGQDQAGFDVAASGGALIVVDGQGAQLLQPFGSPDFELTHTGPKDADANRDVSWEFRWRAPDAPGTYILFGAGNSVDGLGDTDGDESAVTMLTVTVGDAQPTPTPTATPAPPACAGDCSGEGSVTVNELIAGVNIALGTTPVGTCAAFDMNGDGAVSVNELVAAVNNALTGC